MSTKSDRQAAREAVLKYHESQLAVLVERVGDAIDRFRVGELDAFDADQHLSASQPTPRLKRANEQPSVVNVRA